MKNFLLIDDPGIVDMYKVAFTLKNIDITTAKNGNVDYGKHIITLLLDPS